MAKPSNRSRNRSKQSPIRYELLGYNHTWDSSIDRSVVSTYELDDTAPTLPNSIDFGIALKLAHALSKHNLYLDTVIHVVSNCPSCEVQRNDRAFNYITFEMFIFSFHQLTKPVVVNISHGHGKETMTFISWDDIRPNNFWKRLGIFLSRGKWKNILLKYTWMLHRVARERIHENTFGQLDIEPPAKTLVRFVPSTHNPRSDDSSRSVGTTKSNGSSSQTPPPVPVFENHRARKCESASEETPKSVPMDAPKHVPKHAPKSERK